MTKKQQIDYFTRAANVLIDFINNKTTGKIGDQYFNQIVEEEKEHRRFSGDFPGNGLSLFQAVNLYAIQTVLEFTRNERPPVDLRDYFSTRQSIFMAQSIVLNYREQIQNELMEFDWGKICSFDYAQLNRVDN